MKSVKTYCQSDFGTSLNENMSLIQRCPSCDAELSENSAFCPKCGAKIEKSTGINNFNVSQNSSKKKIIIGAAAACIVCLIGFIIFSGDDKQTSEDISEDISYDTENDYYSTTIIDSIKNATNTYYPGTTYGEAFDNFFGSPHWEYFVGSEDDSDELFDVVEFTGTCSTNGIEGDAVIQFTLYDDDTFEMTYFSFDNEAQSVAEMNNLLDTVFSSAQRSEKQNNSDTAADQDGYKEVYSDYISSEQNYEGYSTSKTYYLYDMDYDGSPELIVQEFVNRPDFDQYVTSIFTYKNGSMTKVYENESGIIAYVVNNEILFNTMPMSIYTTIYRFNLSGTR